MKSNILVMAAVLICAVVIINLFFLNNVAVLRDKIINHINQDKEYDCFLKANFTFGDERFTPNMTVEFNGCTIYLKPTMFHINKYGFRGKDFDMDKKEFRILSVGDSFTFGWGLEDDETFSHFLEEKLNKECRMEVEVINLGIPSYQSDDEYRLIRDFGVSLNPDIILITFVGDDWANEEMQSIHDSYFFNITTELMNKTGRDISPEEHNILYAQSQNHMRSVYADETFEVVKDNYEKIGLLAEENGFSILAGYYSAGASWDERLLRLYDALNWTAIDFSDLYVYEFLLNIEDPHPNIRASRTMAERYASEIMNNYCRE